MPKKCAILVDGGFFLKRYRSLRKSQPTDDPKFMANTLYEICLEHLDQKGVSKHDLYRIFYYDCAPYTKKQHNPVDDSSIDFKKSSVYLFKTQFLEELKKKRKVALRLGQIEDNKGWIIHSSKTKELLKGKIQVSDLKPEDVYFALEQKRVDMKIGLDIASITLKKQVSQIVLIAGDSDFVPAAKLARREGIDFVLDSMWHNVKPHLFEHIDGLRSSPKRGSKRTTTSVKPTTHSKPSARKKINPKKENQ